MEQLAQEFVQQQHLPSILYAQRDAVIGRQEIQSRAGTMTSLGNFHPANNFKKGGEV